LQQKIRGGGQSDGCQIMPLEWLGTVT